MTEDELRELGGIHTTQAVSLAGETFGIRDDGLAALIRFARDASGKNPDVATPLPVLYRLLEDCVTDFKRFESVALSARAEMADITKTVNQLISWYCARSHWPAMRLIGYVAGNLEELDGQLIRGGGRGVAALTAREACNVALAICLEDRDADGREAFMMDLNYEGDAEQDALAQLREMQRMQAAAKVAADG